MSAGNVPGLVVDLFAGGGGASVGMEAALGRPVDLAINHSRTAIAVHKRNHPMTRHLITDVFEVDPRVATGGRRVGLLWASPACDHFSLARGGKPRENKIRSLAWVVVDWARAVRPSLILLENVSEFRTWGPLDDAGHPIKERMGETFAQWQGALELLGYQVEWRILDASHYGAPTRRRRLFLVARCDGQAIRWPTPTHGPGRAPLRPAAECIDWSLPIPSIFERSRPLAEKTLRRIAAGLHRFVFTAASPFVVKVNHGGAEHRTESLELPLSTVTATLRGHALVAPTMVQTGYGEREGQAPRALDLHQPLGVVVGGGSKHALVGAYLAKHYGDPDRRGGGGQVVGQGLDVPLGTVTARDHHSLTQATLLPAPTEGARTAEVRVFLAAYYSTDGQALEEPMRTVTARHRLGLVPVAGVEHVIADIGLRMLEPHELLAAQFGRFAASYDLGAAKSKADKIRLIGNSVAPEVAEALVLSNLAPASTRRVA